MFLLYIVLPPTHQLRRAVEHIKIYIVFKTFEKLKEYKKKKREINFPFFFFLKIFRNLKTSFNYFSAINLYRHKTIDFVVQKFHFLERLLSHFFDFPSFSTVIFSVKMTSPVTLRMIQEVGHRPIYIKRIN